MFSTLFEKQIYLGFTQSQPLAEKTYEQTFLGGQPIFLQSPNPSLLLCESCSQQKLTFICQIFCPLQAERCYNRILYIFYCEKCYTFFRAIKQQASSDTPIQKVQIATRVICCQSFQVESEGFQVKQLMKLMHKSRLDIEQQIRQLAEQDEFDSDEQCGEEQDLQMSNIQELGFNQPNHSLTNSFQKQQLENFKQASQTYQDKKPQKDSIFQQYKKIMQELSGPILLYSNVAIPYNSQPVNNKHFCKFCKSKLTLELQLTQKILLSSQKLLGMDWGSLMVFTCANSCEQSSQECVVVQYEVDAIKNSEINLLKKSKKNKKNKERKESHKSKSKQHNDIGKQQKNKSNAMEQEDNEEGDWD